MIEWRPIDSMNYEISKCGQIRNAKTKRLLKVRKDIFGYCVVGLANRNAQKTFRISRLLALTFLPLPLEGQTHVAHINGVRSDNRIENLRWATPKENALDKKIHGTDKTGDSKTAIYLLPDKEVLEIADSLSRGENTRVIAIKHGINVSTVKSIANDNYYNQIAGHFIYTPKKRGKK